MKYFIFLLISIAISACSAEYEPTNNEIKKIYTEAKSILKSKSLGNLSNEQWPNIFKTINVKSAVINRNGLYLKLNQFFTDESGLFIPYQGIIIDVGTGSDSSYEVISNGIYKYRIKG